MKQCVQLAKCHIYIIHSDIHQNDAYQMIYTISITDNIVYILGLVFIIVYFYNISLTWSSMTNVLTFGHSIIQLSAHARTHNRSLEITS